MPALRLLLARVEVRPQLGHGLRDVVGGDYFFGAFRVAMR